jgi:hypothetical protein
MFGERMRIMFMRWEGSELTEKLMVFYIMTEQVGLPLTTEVGMLFTDFRKTIYGQLVVLFFTLMEMIGNE